MDQEEEFDFDVDPSFIFGDEIIKPQLAKVESSNKKNSSSECSQSSSTIRVNKDLGGSSSKVYSQSDYFQPVYQNQNDSCSNGEIKDGRIVQESDEDEDKSFTVLDKTFGDSDEDELLSQIKDDSEQINRDHLSSQTRKIVVIDQIKSQISQTSLIHNQSKLIVSPERLDNMPNFQSSSTSSSNSSPSPMGPPLTSFVPKTSTPNLTSQKSETESPLPSICPTSCLNTSREAFFASWENDEITSYEKRLQTLKRRFPGPAGLLPLITREEAELLSDSEHPFTQQISKIISSDILFHRQQAEASVSDLSPDRAILRINKAPWRELVKILELNPKDPKSLFSLMNIRWIKRTVVKHPVTTKIPFLALVVQEDPGLLGSNNKKRGSRIMMTDTRRGNPSIKLMDPTGSIVAAMDAKFVEMYGSELAPGTAIAVKNTGFLRFRRQVILTITKKNIICMTSMKKTEPNPVKQVKFSSAIIASTIKSPNEDEIQPSISETKEGVKVITFCEFSHTKAVQEYETILNTVLDQEDSCEDRLFASGVQEPKRLFSEAGSNKVSSGTSNVGFRAPRQSPQANFAIDFDAFGNDDDDDLIMKALENVDFLMENEEVSPSSKS